MQVTIQGKQIDLGEALREHVTDKLEDINAKYFNHATDATVTFSKEGHGHGIIKAHISIRIGKEIKVMSDKTAGDPYGAFDAACEKVAKQMRRYKTRLRDHHERLDKTPETESIKARYYTLAAEQDAAEENAAAQEGGDPVVVAELTTSIQTMSVSEAVMRLDLADENAMLFYNGSHDGLNMVYRRMDGNIGWVDPEGNNKETAAA